MPNKKSAKKALRQNEAHRLVNRSKRSRILTEKKKFLALIENGMKENATDLEKVNTAFSQTQSLIGKAVKTKLFHWKKGARLVSRMSDKIKKLQAQIAQKNI